MYFKCCMFKTFKNIFSQNMKKLLKVFQLNKILTNEKPKIILHNTMYTRPSFALIGVNKVITAANNTE